MSVFFFWGEISPFFYSKGATGGCARFFFSLSKKDSIRVGVTKNSITKVFLSSFLHLKHSPTVFFPFHSSPIFLFLSLLLFWEQEGFGGCLFVRFSPSSLKRRRKFKSKANFIELEYKEIWKMLVFILRGELGKESHHICKRTSSFRLLERNKCKWKELQPHLQWSSACYKTFFRKTV